MRTYRFFFLVILFFAAGKSYARTPEKAEQVRIDSVFSAFDKMPDDTNKVNFILDESKSFLWEFDLPENYNKLKYVLKLSKKLGFVRGEYRTYTAMASFCTRVGNNDFSLQYRLKALEKARVLGDSNMVNGCFVGIGLSYLSMQNDSMALLFFMKAKEPAEISKDKDRISRVYSFLGWTYEAMHQDSIALIYGLKALELRKEMNYSLGVNSSLGSVLSMYIDMKNYDKAREIVNQLETKSRMENDSVNLAGCYNFYSSEALRLHRFDSALYFANTGLAISVRKDNKPAIVSSYKMLAQVYDSLRDNDNAYRYFRLYTHLNDSLNEAERIIRDKRTKEIYDLESKNAEIDLLSQEGLIKEKDLEAQRRSLWGLGIVLSFTALLAILVFRGYRQKKRSAEEIGLQKKMVEEKNADITNSIVYAKRIQEALLPSIHSIKNVFPDSFVFYQPKDIVSGDFFWFNETKQNYFIAVVDCTGHGVPGALMSAIGYNFFGQIVNEMRIENSAEILNELHRKVLMALNKNLSSREIKDGMDVCLVRIPKDRSPIEFCGAVRPIYVLENGRMETIKGDIYSIGGVKDANTESFTSHRIEYKSGKTLFLFSDGFADQFGGPRGKKFKYKPFQDLLMTNGQLPMEQQRDSLEKTFNDWKGNLEQVDDVCVVGIRL